MGQEKQRLSAAERANLVAYLDRELNEAEHQAIASKLSLSSSARHEIESLQKTWELLDHLPRPELTTEFTARTLAQLEKLTLPDERLVILAQRAGHRLAQALTLLVSAGFFLAIGFAATRFLWPDPTSRLVRDLSLAEGFDDYRAARSIAFLRELDQDSRFAAEISALIDDPGFGGPAENEARLRAMPRERRLELSEALKRLDRLPQPEQAEVRALDRDLAEMDETNRDRFLALLHRYRLWIQELPEARRQALDALAPEERMAFILREREREAVASAEGIGDRNPAYVRFQFAMLGPLSPFEGAHLLKIWLELPPDRRKEVDALPPLERLKRINELGEDLGIAPRGEFLRSERAAIRRRMASMPQLSQEFEALKAQDTPKANLRAQQIQRLVEGAYLLENEERPVPSQELGRFAAMLPDWFREPLDAMPPEAARRRLTVLYRLTHPSDSDPTPPPSPEGSAPHLEKPSTEPTATPPVEPSILPL